MALPQNAKTIYDYLRSHGYSGNAAAGIVGNIAQESGGSPEAGGPGNAGIIQWTPESKATPVRNIMTGHLQADLANQLRDMLAYNRQQGSAALQRLNSAATPAQAALIYSQEFERPRASAANNPYRQQVAQEAAAAARSGNWKSSTTGSLGSAGGGSGVQSAQLDSFMSSGSGVLADTGALLHGTAVVLDRAFGLFAPGNGWRIVFFGVGGIAGFGAYRAWIADAGRADPGHLPTAIGLTGVAAAALFMAMRPWPQTSGGPVKPGAYVVDVVKGEPPPAGPPTFSAGEVQLTEAGLATLLGIWAAGKAAGAVSGLGKGLGALGSGGSRIWQWIKGLGKGAEGDAGGAAGDLGTAV